MKNRAKFSTWVCCAILLSLPTATHGQSAAQTVSQESHDKNAWLRLANNGAWWNAVSADSKPDFVDGYVSAMTTVHKMLMALIDQGKKTLAAGPKIDSQMTQIIQLSVIAERYDFHEVDRAKILAGMDTFYKDPLNKLIPVDDAFL